MFDHEVPVITEEQLTEEAIERDELDLPDVSLPEGWTLVHHSPEQVVVTNETQGHSQLYPDVYRAEKLFDGVRIEVEASSEEQLAERAEFIDAHREALANEPEAAPLLDPPEVPVTVPEPGDEAEMGQPRDVITNAGDFSDAEWSARHQRDTVVLDDGQVVYSGTGNTDSIDEAIEANEQATAEQEQDAHAEEQVETQQIEYDTADALDSPGQSAGGLLVIPAEANDRDEAVALMNETSQEAENQRVLAATEAAEQEEPTGMTYGPTMEAMAEEHKARLDAQAEAVAHAREEGESEDEAARQAREAGAAAVTERGNGGKSTPEARRVAKELDVDLDEVEGSGEGGKVTKSDVKAYAAERDA